MALLAEYIREQAGVFHIIGGGFDTIHVDEVPVAANLALLYFLSFSDDEVAQAHRVEVSLRKGEQLLFQTQNDLTPQRAADLPPDWRVRGQVNLNFGVLLPEFGEYAFDLRVGGDLLKTMNLRVVQPN